MTPAERRWKVDGCPVDYRCFLCGAWVPVLRSKKERPYLICPDCGYQVFFRLPAGIERLAAAARNREVDDLEMR